MAGIRKRLGSLLGPEGKAGLDGTTPGLVEGETTTVAPHEPARLTLVQISEHQYRIDAEMPRGLHGDPTAVADFGEAMATEITNEDSVGRIALDAAIEQRVGAGFVVSDTEPADPVEGMVWFDTSGLSAPTGLTASTVLGTGVELSWTAPSESVNPIVAYRIYRNDSLLATIGNETSYTDLTVPEGRHSYTVAAVDSADRWSELSNQTTVAYGIGGIDGLIGRWAANDIEATTGEPVESIPAQVGPDFVQPLADNRPTFQPNIVNGHDVIRFAYDDQQWMDAPTGAVNQPITVVAVVNARGRSIITSSGESVTVFMIAETASSEVRAESNSAPVRGIVPWTPADEWMILIQVADVEQSRFYATARTPVSWGAASSSRLPNQLRLGRNSSSIYSEMDVAEIVLFDRAITDEEAQTILDQYSGKYDIVIGV